jgi:hypothetical protein
MTNTKLPDAVEKTAIGDVILKTKVKEKTVAKIWRHPVTAIMVSAGFRLQNDAIMLLVHTLLQNMFR